MPSSYCHQATSAPELPTPVSAAHFSINSNARSPTVDGSGICQLPINKLPDTAPELLTFTAPIHQRQHSQLCKAHAADSTVQFPSFNWICEHSRAAASGRKIPITESSTPALAMPPGAFPAVATVNSAIGRDHRANPSLIGIHGRACLDIASPYIVPQRYTHHFYEAIESVIAMEGTL